MIELSKEFIDNDMNLDYQRREIVLQLNQIANELEEANRLKREELKG